MGSTRALVAALGYAQRGWAVFPLHSIVGGRCSCRRECSHPAKHPIPRRGLHVASTDPAVIRSWWDHWPWANVGLATGVRSGLVVIDVDPASGGSESLTRLQSLMGSLSVTLTARTGGGGLHLVFAHPGGELRNTAGRLPGIAEAVPGLDLRGDGGYVVAPPSRHRSGAGYAWIDVDLAPAPAPAWLHPAPTPQHRPAPPPGGRFPIGRSRYGEAALHREVADLRCAPVGQRNDRLNRAAFSLGTLAAGGELTAARVEDELLAAALDVGLPEGEARASIRSGLRAGARDPRRRPAS